MDADERESIYGFGFMTVGFFAPLPPAPTGVADYAAALLEEMRRSGRVDVGGRKHDVALYHVGNNHLHREIYQAALERPGVVVMHDAVLQHFLLGTLSEKEYCEEFVYNYGEWMRPLAGELWRNRARSAADARYFEYPMLKRIVAGARAVIVHNPAAGRAVLRHVPEARVVEIPHLFVRPELPDAADALRFRESLGLKARTCLVAVFGHLRESKRLPVLLRAMHRAWARGADARLLIAGEFASSDLERAMTPLLGDTRILRTPYLSERDFWRYAAATDVCVNLRFPSAGETSGIAIRMMGIGTPVVFTEGEEIARFPENACLRVDCGLAEEETLADTIVWLSGDREAALEIGRRAALHIAEEHAVAIAAQRYWDALKTG
jgi:glycosyltransferase involved in cell wall biosynthesis